jgi:hypothetical protein
MSCAGGPDLVTNGLVLNIDMRSNKCISNTSSNPFPLNNIITRSLYTNISTTNMTYTNDYGGCLSSNASGSGFTTPAGTWTNLGLTNNFTINFLMDVLSITGTNVSNLLIIESYTTRGFRLGFWGSGNSNSLLFWATESGGTMEINVPNTAFKLPERLFLTVSFDSISGIGKVYKNGFLVGSSSSGRTIVSPNSSDSISFNSILNATSTNLKFLHKSIYNRALTDLEVLQNYKALKGRLNLT